MPMEVYGWNGVMCCRHFVSLAHLYADAPMQYTYCISNDIMVAVLLRKLNTSLKDNDADCYLYILLVGVSFLADFWTRIPNNLMIRALRLHDLVFVLVPFALVIANHH